MHLYHFLRFGTLVACLGAHLAVGGKLGQPMPSLTAAAAASTTDNVADYVVSCTNNPDPSDFTVKLEFDKDDWFEAMCIRSYSRCPFPDGSCLGMDDDWTAESGKSFDFLETRVFYVSDGSSPSNLYVSDDQGLYSCARALYKDQYQDFDLGSSLDVTGWWVDGDPLHVTIVPFNIGSGSCDSGSDVDFDASRALAVWLSPYKGQEQDPGDAGSIYCDLSKNPDDCLNMPYWDIEGDQLVSYGTLVNALKKNPSEISIYIPEGYDVFLPINNNEVRFDISGDMGNWDRCNQWLQDGVSFCKVDKGWVSSYHTNAKITVSGLGRVNGWYTMNKQRDDNIRRSGGEPGDVDTVSDGSDFSGYWSNVGMWYIYAYLLTFASNSGGSGDEFAIDVSGVEVAWGSMLGTSPVSLNSPWGSDPDVDFSKNPVKVYDVKIAGNWNGQSDSIDMMGSHSFSAYIFLHVNDDAVKVASTDTYRAHSTILKGNAGSAVMLGSYGNAVNSNIDNSNIDGVYVHRIVHSTSQYQGCGGMGSNGGVVATRSCGQNSNGLVDATVSNLYIPELGDINSVAQPFGIGVNWDPEWCDEPTIDYYPIRNLRFEHFNIYPEPSCKSTFYDDSSGKVQWGLANPYWASVTFFDADNSNPDACDFQGAVSLSNDPQYFVCGYPDEDNAKHHCMTTDDHIGGLPNVNYETSGDVMIDFPVCSPKEEVVKVA